MSLPSQPVLVKALFLLLVFFAHGRPFEGAADYVWALLVAYLLLFGGLRNRMKVTLTIVGLALLTLGHFMPQLAIPEQQRVLMDDKRLLILPRQFLNDTAKYPYFLTADGYIQGYKDKRFVKMIDIGDGILSLRSGWINRPEYNFVPKFSPFVRENLPFVVRYDITPEMVGMTLDMAGIFVLDIPDKKEGTLQIPDVPRKMILPIQDFHKGAVLYGFGGKWDDNGVNDLTIKLKKTSAYRFYDFARLASFFLGLGFLFFGLFFIRVTLDFRIQSAFLSVSAISFWLDHSPVFRWGILAAGGNDGISHNGFAYWMLEKWALGDWRGALLSPESVFYSMPGMRYIRLAELILFGDSYILQACLLIFVPVIFYRFFGLFLSVKVSISLALLTFAYLFNGIGLSLKIYVHSLLSLYGEGLAYSLLFISLILLAKNIQKVGWGIVAFFLLAITLTIRPNLVIFVGVISALHLFTTTFSLQHWGARFLMLCGLSPILLIPLHNIWGGAFVLLTRAYQIPENLALPPGVYFEALCSLIGLNGGCSQIDRFEAHLHSFYPQYLLAWLSCLWICFKGQTPVVRTFAGATFAGLSVHFFYLPDIRYLHPYLTIAIVLGLSQIPKFRKESLKEKPL